MCLCPCLLYCMYLVHLIGRLSCAYLLLLAQTDVTKVVFALNLHLVNIFVRKEVLCQSVCFFRLR